jgi:hypothetical protein
MTDGTFRDVTNEASWQSSNFNYLSVAGPGLMTAHQRGTVSIGATYQDTVGWQDVVVMPHGTYALFGHVIESRDPFVPVINAELAVTSGPASGQIVTTNEFNGGYRLFGLAGPTTIRVSKDGYRTNEQTVRVEGHQILDIDLSLARPRVDVSGTYTLTLTAADDCAVGLGEGHLPEEARVRRYTAVVTQAGPALSVELSGFTPDSSSDNGFKGRVEPERLVFDLNWAPWDLERPRIAEILTTGEVLDVSGTATTTVSTNGSVGTLAGYLAVFPVGVSPTAGVEAVAYCYSTAHRFVFTR